MNGIGEQSEKSQQDSTDVRARDDLARAFWGQSAALRNTHQSSQHGEEAVESYGHAPQPSVINMGFGDALLVLKRGGRVARAGWNGKGMWLHIIPASHWETTRGLETLDGLPWIGMKTADDKFVPWLASQTDMLAEDWMIV